MCRAVTPKLLSEHILPIARSLSSDPIPNIRFNVAKAFGVMAPVLKKSSVDPSAIKSILVKLGDDSDVDVRYYAQRSLLAL